MASVSPTPDIFLSTPAYSGEVHWRYAETLLKFSHACRDLGWNLMPFLSQGNAIIHHTRNLHVHQFLQTACTHFLTIDADISVPNVEDLCKLVTAPYDICGLPAIRKQDKVKFSVEPLAGNKFVVSQAGWAQVSRIGTSVMCVKREPLIALAKKSPWYWGDGDTAGEPIPRVFYHHFDPVSHLEWGEDYSLCNAAVGHGYKIYALMDSLVHHHGTKTFGKNPLEHMRQ